MRRNALLAAWLVTICAGASAQNHRTEMGWTDTHGYFERRTPNSEHPLQYYLSEARQQEFLHAETDDCAEPSLCNDLQVAVSSQEIGIPDGKVFQIVFSIKTAADSAGNQPYWKSIVVASSPSMYREIFLLRNEGAFWTWPPSTASVTSAGETSVLFSNDRTSSRDLWCTGEFWALEKSGPVVVDFSPVTAAIEKAAPPGSVVITPLCAAVSLEKLQVRAAVQKRNACRTCGLEGSVVVNFKLQANRAVPVSSAFLKDGDN
jgi:hypothetical protein